MSSDKPSCSFSWAQVIQIGDELELPDNVNIEENQIGEECIDAYFKHYYDPLVNGFMYQFSKRVEGTLSSITLTDEMARRVVFLSNRLEQIRRRYEGLRMSANFYEIGQETFITLGQNSAKFGGKQFVDLRVQFRNDAGQSVSTKTGVRYPIKMLTDIRAVLDASTQMATSLKKKSGKIMLYAKVALIEREIRILQSLGSNCHGCFTKHPSQKQHMGEGGCLEETDWGEVVDKRYDEAILGVHEYERMALANAVAKQLGDRGLFIEGYVDKPKDKLKALVCTEGAFKRDLLYITVQKEMKSRDSAETTMSLQQATQHTDVDVTL